VLPEPLLLPLARLGLAALPVVLRERLLAGDEGAAADVQGMAAVVVLR